MSHSRDAGRPIDGRPERRDQRLLACGEPVPCLVHGGGKSTPAGSGSRSLTRTRPLSDSSGYMTAFVSANALLASQLAVEGMASLDAEFVGSDRRNPRPAS